MELVQACIQSILVQACIFGKFGFSRPDLDGNKLAKGMCLARKARDREVFI